MYEDYSRQSLPSRKYRELLGSALCVFNSNNSFVIENILNVDDTYNWHSLIDKTSGQLFEPIARTITSKYNNEISELFQDLVNKRNRIIHSFQVTDLDGQQRLATKEHVKKDARQTQYIITESILLDFIKQNEDLSSLLHSFRGY